MRILILTGLLLLNLPLAFSQNYCRQTDPNATPREHTVDITNMKLEVEFNPEAGLVIGKVTHTFKSLRPQIDSLFFDGPGITIKSAKLDGQAISYVINSNGVTVAFNKKPKWDEIHNIIFEYEAYPKKGIYFIGWNVYDSLDKRNKTRRQIWTQGEGIDNRYWIPMYDNMDDKYTTETVVTFNKSYKVLSNGALKSEKTLPNGNIVWDYAMSKPHSGYLVMLAIDDYAVKTTKTASNVPVQFWYYPEYPEKLEPTSRYSEKIIEFLEKETGVKYPWEQYSQVMVQDFMYGAMENTTATIFGDFFNVDSNGYLDRNYVGVNAHECTHQWFGDLITARSNADIWLQESFATYYPKQFFRQMDGEDKYSWLVKQDMITVLKAAETDNNPVRSSLSNSARIYQKGSLVIDMLRYVLGDEPFHRVIKYYLEKHSYGNVETNDLYQAVQDVLGQSPDWFFEQWLYHGGEPNYKVSYQSENKKVKVKVEQMQELTPLIGLFKMPINIMVYFKNGDSVQKQYWVQKQSEDFYIDNLQNAEIDYVLFDPANKILKKVTFDKPVPELLSQARKAPNMIDRYDAYTALRNIPLAEKRELLVWGFQHETFYALRNEIIKQLMEYDEMYDLVRSRLLNEDAETIKFFIGNFNEIPQGFLFYYETWLSHPSYDIETTVLQKLYDNYPEKISTYLNTTKNKTGQNNNIRIKWLEIACQAGVSKEENAGTLIGYTSPSYEFRTRVAAFEALKRLNICDKTIINNGFESQSSFNGRLSGPIKAVLDYFSQQSSYKKLMIECYKKSEDKKLKAVLKSNFTFLN
jgi:aminopeptidase N